MIRLADLPPGFWLHRRVMEGCQILGPAKILLAGGALDHNSFYGATDRTFVVVPNVADHFADAIVFYECEVSRCEFHNITAIGTAEQIAGLKADMVEA